MSHQDNGQEPLTKRQKRGDDEEAAPEIIAFGGPMYDEATARKILKEEVLISADSVFAEDGEAVIGFDPDDAALDDLYRADYNDYDEELQVTPMMHFAKKGDAKMCRYLISRGASTTKSSNADYPLCYPMYLATEVGHLDVCEILYENGAQNDVRRDDDGNGWTPFAVAIENSRGGGYGQSLLDEVVRWLVLHGALSDDNNSEDVEVERVVREVQGAKNSWQQHGLRSCERLIEWSKQVTQTHSAVVTFLGGTLPPAPDEDQSRTIQCLNGHPGVREHICDFVGLEVTKRKHLRILRSLIDVMPPLIMTEDEE